MSGDSAAISCDDPKIYEEPKYLAQQFESEQMLAGNLKADPACITIDDPTVCAEPEHIAEQLKSEQVAAGNLKAEPAAISSDDPIACAEPQIIAQQFDSEQITAGNPNTKLADIPSDDPTVDAEPKCIAQQMGFKKMTAGNLKTEPAAISRYYPFMDQPPRRADGFYARSPKLDPHKRHANMPEAKAMERPMLDWSSTRNSHEHPAENLTENPTRHTAETLETNASEDPACSFNPGLLGHPELCARPCFHFAKGQCTRGSSCHFCHLCPFKGVHLCKQDRDFLKKTPYQQRVQIIMPLLRHRAASGGFHDQASGLLTQLMPEHRADKIPFTSKVRRAIIRMEKINFRGLFNLLLANEAVSDTTQSLWQDFHELRESIDTAQ